MRDASLERTSYGSLLDSPAFGALRDRGTTRRPTIPRQGSGRRVSSRLSVTRTVTVEGHPDYEDGLSRRNRFVRCRRTTRIMTSVATMGGAMSPNSGTGTVARESLVPGYAPLQATETDPPATIVTLNRIRSVAPRVWAAIVPVVNVASFPKVFPFVGPYNTVGVEQAESVHRSISTEYTEANVTVTLTLLTRTSSVLASASRTPAWRALMSDRVQAAEVVGFVAQFSL